MHWRDTINALGGYRYCIGVYHQYIAGCTVHWVDIMICVCVCVCGGGGRGDIVNAFGGVPQQ